MAGSDEGSYRPVKQRFFPSPLRVAVALAQHWCEVGRCDGDANGDEPLCRARAAVRRPRVIETTEIPNGPIFVLDELQSGVCVSHYL